MITPTDRPPTTTQQPSIPTTHLITAITIITITLTSLFTIAWYLTTDTLTTPDLLLIALLTLPSIIALTTANRLIPHPRPTLTQAAITAQADKERGYKTDPPARRNTPPTPPTH